MPKIERLMQQSLDRPWSAEDYAHALRCATHEPDPFMAARPDVTLPRDDDACHFHCTHCDAPGVGICHDCWTQSHVHGDVATLATASLEDVVWVREQSDAYRDVIAHVIYRECVDLRNPRSVKALGRLLEQWTALNACYEEEVR